MGDPRSRLIVLLFLFSAATFGCPVRLPFAPALSPELAEYSSKLYNAFSTQDLSGLRQLLSQWSATHPPVPEEGDLYASLLTQFVVPATPVQLAIAEQYRERFPFHPERWRAGAMFFLKAYGEGDREEAERWWEELATQSTLDPEVRISLALRLAHLRIEGGDERGGVSLALAHLPPKPSPILLMYLLKKLRTCCDPLTFPENPLTPYLQTLALLAQGLPSDLPQLLAQAKREAEKWGLESPWLSWLSLYPERIPPSRPYAYLLPRDPALYPLSLRELLLLLQCSEEGTTWGIAQPLKSAGSFVQALAEVPEGARILGFVPPELLPILAPLTLKRASYLLLLNPLLPLAPYPHLLSLGVTPLEQGKTLAHLVLEKGYKTVALLLPDSSYGEEFLTGFSGELFPKGGWFSAVLFYPPEEVDFTPILDDLSGRNVTTPRELWNDHPPPAQIDFEVLVIVGPSSTLARLPAQLLFHDIVGVPVLGDISWQHPLVLSAGEPLEGVNFLALLPDPRTSPVGRRFASCSSSQDSLPLPLDLVSFEGLLLLEAEGKSSLPLPSLRFTGVSGGESYFTEKKVLTRTFRLATFMRRGLKIVGEGEPLPLFHPEFLTTSTSPAPNPEGPSP